MDITIEIDLDQAARELNLPLESVQNTVALLDDGNTVPFITRYRKDPTGALDEEQIRRIQEKVGKLRALAERKQTILKSIQAQGQLTAELAEHIRTANSSKRLEDLYLPFKPKKQTLATAARQRGLEPLAREVLAADPAATELRQRAETLVDPEKELTSVDDVLTGVRHIIAEWFSERADVRGRLRKILQRTGRLVCSRIETPARREPVADTTAQDAAKPSPAAPEVTAPETAAPQTVTPQTVTPETVTPEAVTPETVTPETVTPEAVTPEAVTPEAVTPEAVTPEVTARESLASETPAPEATAGESDVSLTAESGLTPASEFAPTDNLAGHATRPSGEPGAETEAASDGPSAASPGDAELHREAAVSDAQGGETPQQSADAVVPTDTVNSAEVMVGQPVVPQGADEGPSHEGTPVDAIAAQASPGSPGDAPSPAPTASAPQPVAVKKPVASSKKSPSKRGPLSAAISKKEKKRQRLESAFKDYFEFQELISRIPPHRVLAINRGERARILRAKIDADVEAMSAEAENLLITADHPHAEFLKSCVRDALGRLVIPSLERELRREMTERAEEHAVDVFARNLRKLLLQPPVHDHRVLAIDPGFRSGCKLTALDEFGNVLGHEIIHVIGKEDWIRAGRKKLVELIKRHQLSVVAIGNGAACRETEQLVVDVMANELKEEDIAFLIVNEAGASVYSTSALGREELPTYDAVLRSSISIGRRLLDPLSELVKINPANIGVGMYQHDVKAKHLRTSLDAVVESCVNYVGVDVNTASPALLRYVSGMNQLTARRLCEFRGKNGPFRNREQLMQVPGLGEATFIQAAGFLKITKGDNPLDTTWIHPESYELARKILEQAGCNVADLAAVPVATPEVLRVAEMAASEVAATGVAAAEQPHAPAEPHEEHEEHKEHASGEAHDAATLSEPVPGQNVSEETSSESPVPQPPPDDIATAAPPVEVSETHAESPATEPEAADSEPSEPAASPGDVTGDIPDASAAEVPSTGEPATSRTGTASAPESLRVLQEKVRQLDVGALADGLSVSRLLLSDIVSSLARPGRDPREDFPAPVFRRGIVKLEDLEPGMKLSGTVLNVVDFGAFVDIGLSDSGLVHISRLADRFVRDPHEVVGVGDVLTVWVVDVDKQRRRVSLTAIEPGTARPHEARRESARPRKPAGKRPAPRGPQGERRTKEKVAGQVPRPKSRQRSRPAQRPKFVTPITKEMAEGKEPLRSFSDLMQFYQKKQTDENDPES